jgi:hypothetical protein
MNGEFAFRLLLGALSLAGCGLFFIFFLLFGEEREVDPIYRQDANSAPGECPPELHCDVA